LKIELAIMLKLIKLSLGGIGQSSIATTSWIGLVRIIAEFGSISLAGYTIGIRIIVFAILPAWGIANAASTLVGQNLGANRPDRAEKAVWMTGFFNSLVLGLISLFLIMKPEFFIGFFTSEVEVIKSAVLCLRIVSYGYIFYALGMVVIQSLNGSGDTITPTIINLFCFWLFEIPLAYLLAMHLGFAEKGVYISIFLAESLMTLTALIIFRNGKWKLKKV
ncbi:MAG: MATE family efflux transporter, partial [Bacteroidales bacterium]